MPTGVVEEREHSRKVICHHRETFSALLNVHAVKLLNTFVYFTDCAVPNLGLLETCYSSGQWLKKRCLLLKVLRISNYAWSYADGMLISTPFSLRLRKHHEEGGKTACEI